MGKCIQNDQNITKCYKSILPENYTLSNHGCNSSILRNATYLWKNLTKYRDGAMSEILKNANDTRSDKCPVSSEQCCPYEAVKVNFFEGAPATLSLWPCGLWRSAIVKDPTNFWNFYYYSKYCCCGNHNGTLNPNVTSTAPPVHNGTNTSTSWPNTSTYLWNTSTPTRANTSTSWPSTSTVFWANTSTNWPNTSTIRPSTSSSWSSSTSWPNTTFWPNSTFSPKTDTFWPNYGSSKVTNSPRTSTTTPVNDVIMPDYLVDNTCEALTLGEKSIGSISLWETCDGNRPFEDWMYLAHYSHAQLAQMTLNVGSPIIIDSKYICIISNKDQQTEDCIIYNTNCKQSVSKQYLNEYRDFHPCHMWSLLDDFYSRVFYKKFCSCAEVSTVSDIIDTSDTKCPKETVFNLESGLCEHYSNDYEEYNDVITDTVNTEEYIHCPPGEMYCLEKGYCASDCSYIEPQIDQSECPKGTEFCPPLGVCTLHCLYRRDLRSLWINKGSRHDDNEDGCSGNRRYCPAINACSENCDFIHSKHLVNICKIGYVSFISVLICFVCT